MMNCRSANQQFLLLSRSFPLKVSSGLCAPSSVKIGLGPLVISQTGMESKGMKQSKRKVYALLLLAVIALPVCGFSCSQAAPKSPISFGGATVAVIPIQRRNRHNPLSPDTLAEIKINIAQNAFTKRIYPMATASKIRDTNQYLSDARGVKYFWTAPANSLAPRSKFNAASMLLDGDGSAVTYSYQINLAQYPKSAGRITFHATYVINDFRVPVSVVVRN